MDLSALEIGTLPACFGWCRKLAFVCLPVTLEELPDRSFAGCMAWTSASLARCRALRSIGEGAFEGCSSFELGSLPPAMARLGLLSFAWSGVRSISGEGCVVAVGDFAFAGCVRLGIARFGVVSFGADVFTCCKGLRALSVGRLDACEFNTLDGCGVSELTIGGTMGLRTKLVKWLTRPGDDLFAVTWADGWRDPIRPMTELHVLGGSLAVEESHRAYLFALDISCVTTLPEGWSFSNCPFLERVQLPTGIETIPEMAFYGCGRLGIVNVGECTVLREIGWEAFGVCWMLENVEVPQSCRKIDFGSSGLTVLDVRAAPADRVILDSCMFLQRLILHPEFRGVLSTDHAASMEDITMGKVDNVSWIGPRPTKRLRVVAAGFPSSDDLRAVFSSAIVLGEVAAACARAGRPLLPC
jgi:hypothetical protein